MTSGLTLTTSVRIEQGSSISYEVLGSGEAEFNFDDRPELFGFSIEADALREFLKVGAQALDEMDALFEQEQG